MTVKELNAKVEELEARLDDMYTFHYKTSKESADLIESVINENKLLVAIAKNVVSTVEQIQNVTTLFGVFALLAVLFALFI